MFTKIKPCYKPYRFIFIARLPALLPVILFILLIIFSNNVSAQTDTTKKSSDRINVFDRNDTKTPYTIYNDAQKSIPLNAVKINPLLLFSGDFPVYYERQVSKNISVEGAAGITIKNYFLQNVNDDGILSLPFLTYNPGWNTGYSLKASIKIYPGKENIMDGFYFSPELALRSNGLQYFYLDPYGNPTSSTYAGRYIVYDFRILIGDEWELFDSDNVIGDLYFGIGLQSHNANYLETRDSNGDIVNIVQNYSALKPYIYLGYKIGLKWR